MLKKRITILELWGRGGMLHYTSQFARAIHESGKYDVHVVLPSGSDAQFFPADINISFVPVIKGNSLRDLLLLPWYLVQLPIFLHRIFKTRPQLIHINNCHSWYFLALPFLQKKFPIVSTLHDIEPHPGADDTFRKRREITYLVRKSKNIFVHGSALKTMLLEKFPKVKGVNVHVIPHGNYNFLASESPSCSIAEPCVLFFGRIRAYKGLDVFLAAARKVAKVLPDTKFVIAGNGDIKPYEPLFKGDIKLEVHNRFIPDDEIPAFFNQASFVVLPYIEASQSGVIPLAYAFRKTVIASRVGSISEMVEDGHTGILVDAGDSEILAQEMLALLKNKSMAEAYGRNGFKKAQRDLGWGNVMQGLDETYVKVIT